MDLRASKRGTTMSHAQLGPATLSKNSKIQVDDCRQTWTQYYFLRVSSHLHELCNGLYKLLTGLSPAKQCHVLISPSELLHMLSILSWLRTPVYVRLREIDSCMRSCHSRLVYESSSSPSRRLRSTGSSRNSTPGPTRRPSPR